MDQTQLLNLIQQKVTEVVKELIEKLALEEREIYLEEHPETRANGFYDRSLDTTLGRIEGLRVPRTRDGMFRPHVIPYRRRALFDLGEVVTLMFASGVSTRQISRFINTVYGVYYSPSSISRLTKIARETIEAWRNRELSEEYYAVYVDATFLNITRGYTSKEPVYVVLGVDQKGVREILGFWLFGAEGESSYNWIDILRDLKRRGVKRVRIFVSDDLPGLKEAIRLEFPSSDHQLCISHAIRNSLNKVRKRDKSAVAEDLRKIYSASSVEKARIELKKFARAWGKRYPQVVSYWEQNFHCLVSFLKYPESVRPHIYTTNLLERLMKEIKRRVKVIEVFCSEEAAEKVLYLVLSELNERYKRYRLLGFAKLPQEEGLAVVEN